jgi:hypothetical protein
VFAAEDDDDNNNEFKHVNITFSSSSLWPAGDKREKTGKKRKQTIELIEFNCTYPLVGSVTGLAVSGVVAAPLSIGLFDVAFR